MVGAYFREGAYWGKAAHWSSRLFRLRVLAFLRARGFFQFVLSFNISFIHRALILGQNDWILFTGSYALQTHKKAGTPCQYQAIFSYK